MSRQFWSEQVAWATSSGASVANTAAETVLFPNVTIPANYMSDGRTLRLIAFGGYGTTGTPTIIFRCRWGGVSGTVLAASSTVTLTSSVGGGASMTALWTLIAIIQTRANGANGTLMTNGLATMFTSSNATAGTVTNYGLPMPIVSGSSGGHTPVVATVDLTTDTALALTVQWGTANAANAIVGHNYTVEALN